MLQKFETKQFFTFTSILESQKPFTFAAAARQQRAIIRMMMSSRAAAARCDRDNARYYATHTTASQFLDKALHGVVIANLHLCYAISQQWCKLAPKLLYGES